MSLLKQVVTMLFQKLVNKMSPQQACSKVVNKLLTRCVCNRIVASLLTSCDNSVQTTCQQHVFAIGL
jgi:hypothetical protein